MEEKNIKQGDYSNIAKIIMSSNNNIKTDMSSFSINDLNNFVGSNRKLVINEGNEFWVHDTLLIKNSKYFGQLFDTKERQPTKEEKSTFNNTTITKTYIDVPHPEYFFDILTWIYTKDSHRLSSTADEP